MKKRISIIPILLATAFGVVQSQDTFSIVAADSTTHEVGSAGASCLDLFQIGISDPSFLGDLLPDTGAINSQAYYLAANQTNARNRMRLGDSPQEVINWLAKHDAQANPTLRQYGIAGFSGGTTSAAGYTGNNCDPYKNHKTGSINGVYYSIQGNILLGQHIIDSMEARFRRADGDIACKLMEALQGANRVGADTRCAGQETSSMFAFLKVAQPEDAYGDPSFKISVRTHENSFIEPIDTLQKIFDAAHSCEISATKDVNSEEAITLYPNPAQNTITVFVPGNWMGVTYSITDSSGKLFTTGLLNETKMIVDIHQFVSGVYFFRVGDKYVKRFIKS